MTVTPRDAGQRADQRVRTVLQGLRAVPSADDGVSVLSTSDARAILNDTWSMLAEVLAEGTSSSADEVLTMLRRLGRIDDVLRHRQTAGRIGEVLAKLEAAECSRRGLVEMAPGLIGELGFDRGIISRIDEGVWTPEVVFVADDPQWADAIRRVGQEHPQLLTPALVETQLVRRRQSMVVYDAQHNSRVYRALADEARTRSYVAAPIISGDRVIGMVHGDCYLQRRDIDDFDREVLLSFARGLQLALSRAAVVERLQSIGDALNGATAGLNSVLDGARNASLGIPRLDQPDVVTNAVTNASDGVSVALPTATGHAGAAVRDVLTDREFEVLQLVAVGRTNAAIASRLFIAEGTVKQHVKHILRKLRVENRAEAVSRLYQSAS